MLHSRQKPAKNISTKQQKKLSKGSNLRLSGQQKRCVACNAVDAIEGLRPELDRAIEASLKNCLTYTDLKVGVKEEGKVRDTYDLGDRLIIVTTDRQSAFDRVLAAIPYKGQVLNQLTQWWMQRTAGMAPNALLAAPDPNVIVMKKCTVFPVEFVMRGYLTGSTSTSIWTHYAEGARSFCGNPLPPGLKKNDKLESSILTPSTKSKERDVSVSVQEIVDQALMTEADIGRAAEMVKKLFQFGQDTALQRGLILVDTKYELGKDRDGNICLVDEIHTPDSSRYWLADTYQQRHSEGLEPENIDKEFLRLWFKSNCDPYQDRILPEAPKELVVELARRYIYLYEKITGEEFVPADTSIPVQDRIMDNLQTFL